MRKMNLLFLFLICLAPLLQAGESLPPYHWSWKYLDYLKVAGLLPELDMTNRPVYREDVARQLLGIDPEQMPQHSLKWRMVRILYREFRDEIEEIGRGGSGADRDLMKTALERLQLTVLPETATSGAKIGAFGSGVLIDRDNRTDFTYQLHTQLGLKIGQRFTFYNNMKIFNEPPPGYIGKKFRNLYAYSEQAYFMIDQGLWRFKIGRDFLQIGPGRTGQLLISDNSRPFDMYHMSFGKRYFNLSFWGIALNPRPVVQPVYLLYGTIAKRYLNGHRLSVNIKNRYFLGASEVVVYGGPNAGWDLAFMNPFALYYGHQSNGPFSAANLLYNLDWDVYLPHRLEFYGEWLIDDLQVDKKEPGDLEPNEMGLLAGVNWADPLRWSGGLLNAEYVQVRNRTYNAPVNDWEKYLHRHQVIGYYLGNDFKRWAFSLAKWVRADSRLKLFANLIRKGEGSVAGEFNTDYLNYTVAEGYHEAFPWGIVERHWQWGAAVFYRPHPLVNVTLNLAYNDFQNYRHQSGVRHSEFSFSLNCWLQWDRVFHGRWLGF